MSSIDKLLIRGIRSFDPDQSAVIEFYSPVTLIVGHNGAGKTTIIECLKYATTGDLPPNAKGGGAFVHDPKLCGETEVKGQVKLKFRNVKGQTLVVTRSMQAAWRKGGKVEMKTLESVLVSTDPVTGEQVSISGRVAELDAEIPVQLGVSRAVLEDVIFCHQEDSQWPLSEPAVLKKRFDELFAATRYTKALDALRSSRKELLAELKLEQQKMEFLRSDREKALKLQATMNLTERHVEECREKIAHLNAEIESTNGKVGQLQEELLAFASLFAELERMQHEVAALTESICEMEADDAGSSHLESLSEEEIKGELEQYSRFINDHHGELALIERNRASALVTINSRQMFTNSLLSERGTIIALIEEAKRKKSALDQMGAQLSDIFELEADFRLDAKCIDHLSNLLETSAKQLHHHKQEFAELSHSFSDQQNQLLLKKNSLEEIKRLRHKTLDESRRKLILLIRGLEELESAESQSEELRHKLAEEERAAELASRLLSSGNYEKRMADLDKKRREMEVEIKTVNRSIAEQSEVAESRAKLELKMSEKGKREEAQGKILSEIKGDLAHFGVEASAADIDKEVERCARAREQETRTIQDHMDRALQRNTMLTSRHDHLQGLLADKEGDLAQKTRQVSAAIGDHCSAAMLLEDCETEYKERLAESMDTAAYGRFAQQMSSSHSCPVCSRAFGDKAEERHAVQRLERRSASADSLGNDLRKLEERLDMLRKLKTVCEDIDHIRQFELVELSRELEKSKEEREKSDLELQELRSEHSKRTLDEKKLQVLKRRADEYVRIGREVKSLQNDIQFLKGDVQSKSSCSLNMTELRSQLGLCEEQYRSIVVELEALGKESRQRQLDAQAKSTRFRDVKEELMQLQLKQSEKSSLIKSKEDTEDGLQACEREILHIDAELASASETHVRQHSEFNHQLASMRSKVQSLEERHDERRIALSSFRSQYSDYIALGNPSDRLEVVDKQLADVSDEIQRFQSDISHMDAQIMSNRQGASEMISRDRTLKTHLKLRDTRRKVSAKRGELETVSGKLCNLDKHSLTSQLNSLQLHASDLMGQRSGVSGELRQLEEQLLRLSKELSSDYPNIEGKYREQCIKVEASQLAANDLERYAKALDQAIMRYHAAKMDEVNRTLRDLWGSVYTGSDIDAVEIRADAELSTSSVSMRSYNYRVVMLKGPVELDMRGRSSAGQRVLTSLLIRLALADTFAAHCGVLALDEPTTNLDRDNIAALAEALADLIKTRREQHNFQLIVITHDEEFVEALARHECAEYYWRIGKDNRQHSVIERQTLTSF